MVRKTLNHAVLADGVPNVIGENASSVHYAAVLHDVNNMLCAILGQADLIAEEIPREHACHAKAAAIVQAARKCSDLLGAISSVKADCRDRGERIKITHLIDEILSLVKLPRKPCITIETCHQAVNSVIYGNTTELGSALMNLFLNGIEAMPDGGRLQISTLQVANSNDSCGGMGTPKGYIQIEINDTGVGIPSDKLHCIFDPFFSTKPSSEKQKRGLGLYRVRQCIISHDGMIQVSSIPAHGTTFTVRLPAANTST